MNYVRMLHVLKASVAAIGVRLYQFDVKKECVAIESIRPNSSKSTFTESKIFKYKLINCSS